MLARLLIWPACSLLCFGWPTYRQELKDYLESHPGHYEGFETPLNASDPANITAYIPDDVLAVDSYWTSSRALIASQITGVEPIGISSRLNNVSSIVALNDLSNEAAPAYIAFVEGVVAGIPSARYSFGPNNSAVTKSLGSLQRKVWQKMEVRDQTEEYVVQRIGDSLRGSIYVQDPREFASVIQRIKANLPGDSSIMFENFFEGKVSSAGYIAVHGAVDFDGGPQLGIILAELQVHLQSVYDGSQDSPKEDAHFIYQVLRQVPAPVPQEVTDKLNAASKLIFSFALNKTLSEQPLSFAPTASLSAAPTATATAPTATATAPTGVVSTAHATCSSSGASSLVAVSAMMLCIDL